MYLNWKRGAAEGLSFAFLGSWLLGDIANLVGCLLTQQVQTQLITAIYFCVIDSMMVGQYMYYNKGSSSGKTTSAQINSALVPIMLVAAVPIMVVGGTMYGGGGAGEEAAVGIAAVVGAEAPSAHLQQQHGRALLFQTMQPVDGSAAGHDETKWAWDTTTGLIGYVFGWVSGSLYFGSRMPQILKNFRRKSCEGLSPIMFTMAVCGNLFYGCGVLMESVEGVFVVNHLPWLIGSVGTLLFDFTIMVQYVVYGDGPDNGYKAQDAEKARLLGANVAGGKRVRSVSSSNGYA
jgi:uncharacterized protein with PQ loop repeat